MDRPPQNDLVGFAVTLLKTNGDLPVHGKRFLPGNCRHSRLDAEIQLLEEAVGEGFSGPKPQEIRDRYRVVHFRRLGGKGGPVMPIAVFDNPIVGKRLDEVRLMLAKLRRERWEPDHKAKPPGVDAPGG